MDGRDWREKRRTLLPWIFTPDEDVEKDCEGYDSPDWNVVGVNAGHGVGV